MPEVEAMDVKGLCEVKPLEWQTSPSKTTWCASAPVGRYFVWGLVPNEQPAQWCLEGHAGVGAVVDTDDAAKAAAQADYEQRILSALKPATALSALSRELAEARAERDAESRNAGRYADEALALRGDIAAADALRDMWHDRALAAEAKADALREALEPFAGCIFNDNGDITVNFRAFMADELIAAYFAHKRARARSTKEQP